MERCVLAPGLEISRVLTGLWQVADMERDGHALDPEASAADMEPYVSAGLTTFDMADHYGSAEVIAGHFRVTRPEAPVELLTKWVPEPGPCSRDDVEAAVDRAVARLGGSTLDLLQFHAWRYSDPGWLDALFHLDDLRREGRIHHLGLTNVDTAHLAMLLDTGIPLVSNQVCFSLLDRRARNGMLELCAARGVKVLAFGTLAGGLLTERWLDVAEPDPDDLETWSQMKYARFVEAAGGWSRYQGLLRALQRVAVKHGVSMATVATRAILDEPAVGGVIVGARLGVRNHLDDTLRVFDLVLDDSDRATLGEAMAALDPIPGDCGDEYRRPPFLTASGDLSHHLAAFPPPYPVVEGPGGRRQVRTGTVWEDRAGFSRAVRHGNRILVSGTTATHGTRLIGGADPASQTHFVLDKIEGALQSLGAELDHVVRTRIYVRHADEWEPVSRAHGARLGHVAPANTLVRADLIGDDYRVEVEAEALLPSD